MIQFAAKKYRVETIDDKVFFPCTIYYKLNKGGEGKIRALGEETMIAVRKYKKCYIDNVSWLYCDDCID